MCHVIRALIAVAALLVAAGCGPTIPPPYSCTVGPAGQVVCQ